MTLPVVMLKMSARALVLSEATTYGRFNSTPENASFLTVVQREEIWPSQTKYKKNPTLQG